MKTLTKSEEQVMQVLWNLGEGFLRDIVENSPEPHSHPNTVATLLKILIDKGFVDYRTVGRNNLYNPQVSKDEYGKRLVNRLIKGYFEGSPAKLVLLVLQDRKLSPEDLETLVQQFKTSKDIP